VAEATVWTRIPRDVERLIFEFSAPRDRIVAFERVCRRWRDESRCGVGWTTTFNYQSEAWRYFVRFDRLLPHHPRTFAEYLACMGTRLARLETFDNVGPIDAALAGSDAPLLPLALTSLRLRSVRVFCSSAPGAFARALWSTAPRLTDSVNIICKYGSVPLDPDPFSTLFPRLRARKLVLRRVGASLNAYQCLSRGPASAALTDLEYGGGDRDPSQSLGYIAGLRALRRLHLQTMTCATLPSDATHIRDLTCESVAFAAECYSAYHAPSTPFGKLESLSILNATESRLLCATIVASATTLCRLSLCRLRSMTEVPGAADLFLKTLATCRLSSLTALNVIVPGIQDIWHSLVPILAARVAKLTTLALCNMSIGDNILRQLAQLAAKSTSDKCPTLVLRSLSLNNNAELTVPGIIEFVQSVNLQRLEHLDLRRAAPLIFSSDERQTLANRLPALKRFLHETP
jgi:hypothetical protein